MRMFIKGQEDKCLVLCFFLTKGGQNIDASSPNIKYPQSAKLGRKEENGGPKKPHQSLQFPPIYYRSLCPKEICLGFSSRWYMSPKVKIQWVFSYSSRGLLPLFDTAVPRLTGQELNARRRGSLANLSFQSGQPWHPLAGRSPLVSDERPARGKARAADPHPLTDTR